MLNEVFLNCCSEILNGFDWDAVDYEDNIITISMVDVNPVKLGLCWRRACKVTETLGLDAPASFNIEHMIFSVTPNVHVIWKQNLVKPDK